MRSLVKLCLAGVALVATASAAHAATIPVTTTTDAIKIDGLCSLREAILAAGADQPLDGIQAGLPGCVGGTAGEDTIQLGPGTYSIAPQGPTTPDDLNLAGDYDVVSGNRVRLLGAGIGATTIIGSNDRLFDVGTGSSLAVADLTLFGGRAMSVPGVFGQPAAPGGAIRSRGSLTVDRVAFAGNAAGTGIGGGGSSAEPPGAGGAGGAIFSSGTLTVRDAAFTGNAAGTGGLGGDGGFAVDGADGGSGGAITSEGGSATVSGALFSDNAAGPGGGVKNYYAPRTGGRGGSGGAVAVSGGSFSIVNSTFVGNRAGVSGRSILGAPTRGGNSGAVNVSGGSALIQWSTFVGNSAAPTPVEATTNGIAGASVGSSILADAAPACRGVLPAGGNVSSGADPSCPPATRTGDLRLGPLGANGGPTLTVLPGAGSPAIDALSGVGCPATDQRGLPRPAFGGCDAGAVEVQPPPVPVVAAPVAKKTLAPGATTARRITGVTLSRTAFRTYGTKKGTTLGVRLNTPSSIVLTVTKPATGRRSKGKCLAPTKKLSGKPRCTRQVPLRGSISKAGKAGLNTIAFSGKLRGRALSPGAYTFVLTLPKRGSAKAVVATKGFRVIP